MHERAPDLAGSIVRPAFPAQQEELDRPSAGHPVTQQSRREHTRVVGDEQISRIEEPGEVAYRRMLELAGSPIELQQPRLSAR
jgi:hypothetical protein